MKKALVMMAHGSRNALANQEFRDLVSEVAKLKSADYSSVQACFLELAEPSFLSLAQELYRQGCRTIDFYPLFFNQGRHVQADIPSQIDDVRNQFPDLTISQLPHFGANPLLAAFIASHISLL